MSFSSSYTYVLVAADQTTLSATRITSLAGFVSTLMAAFSGIVARYIRYLKPIVIFGFCVESKTIFPSTYVVRLLLTKQLDRRLVLQFLPLVS